RAALAGGASRRARAPTRAPDARPRPRPRGAGRRRDRARLRRRRRPRRPDARRRRARRRHPAHRQRPPGRSLEMSAHPRDPAAATPGAGKLPLPELYEMKRRGDKISVVTAYDAPAALLADRAGVELILVGDTAAMVMLGHESTIPVTLDEM